MRSTLSRKILACLAACAIFVPSSAGAQQATEDWQSIDALTATVANALGRTATPIDRRIKLARCPKQASITAIDARTLAVRCAPLGWRLRVPMTGPAGAVPAATRSEEHTSELQSLMRNSYAGFCLTKKTKHTTK